MMLAEFDSRAFGDDVAARVKDEGRGAANRAIKATGISHASFYRLLDGPPVTNINIIMSAAAHFQIPLRPYFKAIERDERATSV
jgi:hypothetical protein